MKSLSSVVGGGVDARTSREVVLGRDGAPVVVRPIAPEDHEALRAATSSLSPETRLRRFLGLTGALTDAELAYFTEVDHIDHEALVAIDAGGNIIGVGRYIRSPTRPTEAEVALVVADDWQGDGIGGALTERLTARARSAGVETFTASCFAWNHRMINLLKGLGPTESRIDSPGEVSELRIRIVAP